MIPLPAGWSESFVSRRVFARERPGHEAEILRSRGWCVGHMRSLYYFWGWWLAGWYWLAMHERTHARHAERGWPVADCPWSDCVMAERPEYLAILKRRIRTGSWHCPECARRMREERHG